MLIIDIKTGAPLRWHPFQLAMYREALIEMGGNVDAGKKIKFNQDKHRYFIDNIEYPSVSRCLSPVVDKRFFTEDERQRGTDVHLACQYYLQNMLDIESFNVDFPHYAGYLQAFELFLNENDLLFEDIHLEVNVACRKYGYAGRVDMIVPNVEKGKYVTTGVYLRPDGKYKMKKFKAESSTVSDFLCIKRVAQITGAI